MTLFADLDTHGDRFALIDEGGTGYSYQRLLQDGGALAASVGGRRLVFIVTTNSYASVAAYVGFLRGGIVPLLINHTATDADVAALIHRFQPSFVFAPRDLSGLAAISGKQNQLDGHWLHRVAVAESPTLHPDLALLLSTSGSTGGGTFVRLSANNLMANTHAIMGYLPISQQDRTITTMPMSYTYGLSVINTHLVAGGALVATDTPMVNPLFWELMRRERVTNLNGVPFIYDMLRKLRFGRMDLPALRFLTQAGGKLPAEHAREFAEMCAARDQKFYIMYGQTEATARIAYLPPEKLAVKADSIGQAVEGGRLWLANDQGQKITVPGTPGELMYEGPNVAMGVAETSQDLARGDNLRGLLHTGDIAMFDEEGDFAIVGRKKRVLKLFGNRVSLDDLEQKMAAAGFKAACTGVDDALKVTLEGEQDPATARRWLLDNTSIPAKGLKVSWVATLPRTDAGKISYHALDLQEGLAS